MSKQRKRRHRKPPKGSHNARGARRPLNLTGEVDPAEEIERLRRQAARLGVPELLVPDEAAFATMPKSNVTGARQVLAGIKMGATVMIDPAAVFDLAHLVT